MAMILNQPQSEGAFGQASARFALLRGEIARRGALAFQPRPADVRGPKWQALLGELRTPVEHWQASRQARISDEPQLDSRPVMLLPGFGTHPVRMKPLARALSGAIRARSNSASGSSTSGSKMFSKRGLMRR